MIRAELGASVSRIYRFMTAFSLAGVAFAGVLAGWKEALGFATGAAFSMVNFWFWHRLARRVGEKPQSGAGRASIVTFALRYFLFAGGLYVTIRYFEASSYTALIGIFVAVAAVLLEALIELIYGTS